MSIYKSSLIAKVRLDPAKVRLVQASLGGSGKGQKDTNWVFGNISNDLSNFPTIPLLPVLMYHNKSKTFNGNSEGVRGGRLSCHWYSAYGPRGPI
jgi:hypothetical protein